MNSDSTSPRRLSVRRVAVLGAGVMGAQIAAHLVNAGVPVAAVRPAGQGRRPERIRDARRSTGLRKLEPAPLATQGRAQAASRPRITTSDLARLARLRPGDRGDRRAPRLEADLYEKIAPHIAPDAMLASNTSGLSHRRAVEGVAGRAAAALLRRAFLQSAALHASGGDRSRPPKRDPATPRRARDVPHDDARQGRHPRQGHAELHRQPHRRFLGAGDDAARRRVRPRLRRRRCADRARDRPREERHLPHRATSWASTRWRTSSRRCATRCPTIRGMRCSTSRPRWPALVAQGALGQKTQGGLSTARRARTSRCSTRDGRLSAVRRRGAPTRSQRSSRSGRRAEQIREAARVARIRRRNSCGRSSAISSTTARSICGESRDNARDVDLAIRWGFGWTQGPFETWQARGVAATSLHGSARTSRRARRSQRVPLPGLGRDPAIERTPAAYMRRMARIPPTRRAFVGAARCPSIAGSTFPTRCRASAADTGTTIFETDARAHVASAATTSASCRSSSKTAHDRRGRCSTDCCARSIDAERECAGLVIWQTREPFSLGANLGCARARDRARQWDGVEAYVAKFQQTAQRLRYSLDADGCGGARHGARRLVRIHPALRPHGCGARVVHRSRRGGRRACCRQAGAARNWPCALPRKCGAARTAASSTCSRFCGRISRASRWPRCRKVRWKRTSSDTCAPAIRSSCIRTKCCTSRSSRRVRSPMPATGLRCRRATSRSRGRTGIATLTMLLVNMREGGFITPYDYEVGVRLAARDVRRRRRCRKCGRRALAARARARANSWRCCATSARRRALRTRLQRASRYGTEPIDMANQVRMRT